MLLLLFGGFLLSLLLLFSLLPLPLIFHLPLSPVLVHGLLLSRHLLPHGLQLRPLGVHLLLLRHLPLEGTSPRPLLIHDLLLPPLPGRCFFPSSRVVVYGNLLTPLPSHRILNRPLALASQITEFLLDVPDVLQEDEQLLIRPAGTEVGQLECDGLQDELQAGGVGADAVAGVVDVAGLHVEGELAPGLGEDVAAVLAHALDRVAQQRHSGEAVLDLALDAAPEWGTAAAAAAAAAVVRLLAAGIGLLSGFAGLGDATDPAAHHLAGGAQGVDFGQQASDVLVDVLDVGDELAQQLARLE